MAEYTREKILVLKKVIEGMNLTELEKLVLARIILEDIEPAESQKVGETINLKK